MQALKEKKRKNIVEYVIYLWHVEDLLRSVNFELDRLKKDLFQQQGPASAQGEITRWYSDYVDLMKTEEVTTKGHTSMVNEAITEMSYLHNSLLTVYQDKEYMALFEKTKPYLDELKQKSDNKNLTPIEMCMNGIYGVLILKLKGKAVSDETTDAVKTFSALMNHLAAKYKDVQEGKPLFSSNINN